MKLPKTYPEPLSDDEIRQVLDTCLENSLEGSRKFVILSLLFDTSLRNHGLERAKYRCSSIPETIQNKRFCYSDGHCGYKYWDITLANPEVFLIGKLIEHEACPFQGGLNQLWSNTLLALAVENSMSERWPFMRVYFSVVHHPKNQPLNNSIDSFRQLLGTNDRFSSFTSDELIHKAKQSGFYPWIEWLNWFVDVYNF